MANSYIEPLGKYFALRPRAPLALRPASNVWELFSMAGGTVPSTCVAKDRLGKNRSTYYWPAYANGDPMLTAWLKTDAAFRPPSSWPCELDFPDRVTPFRFARDVIGARYYTQQRAALHEAPGWEVLHAWAHGWPVHPREFDQAKFAAAWLMTQPNFLVWAYDLDFDCVPMPFESNIGYFRRLQARSRFDEDPLGLGAGALRWAIPKALLDPNELLKRVHSKSEGVGKSVKLPKIKGLEVDGVGRPLEKT